MRNTKKPSINFRLEDRGGCFVKVDKSGCQPATTAEVALWFALHRAHYGIKLLADVVDAESPWRSWSATKIAAFNHARAILKELP